MSKAKKISYWIFTAWLALGMTSTGIVQLIKMDDEVSRIESLGYPVYLLTLLGIWKLLGVVAILVPKFPVIKEWAYAGFFFTCTGAAFSHLNVHDSIGDIFTCLLLLALTITSYLLRPASRKTASANQ